MPQQVLNIILSICLVFTTVSTLGVPAFPHPITKIQPDGSEITVSLKGDEFHKYELTVDGYLIKKDATGFYKYHKQDSSGRIINTGITATQIEKRTTKEKQLIGTMTRYPNFSRVNQAKRMAKATISQASIVKQNNFPAEGSPKSIVILVNFKDLAFVTPNPNTAFTNLLNEEGYTANRGTGSARDYFKAASNGASSPEFVVVGPYTLPNKRAYYGENDTINGGGDDIRPREMVVDACAAAAKDGVDFSIYDTDNDGIVDNVFIYYAGHNEAEYGPDESIWPHRWWLEKQLNLNGKKVLGYACTSELSGRSGSNMCGIGTFCHEFGHVYGLPDYYNTNDPSAYTLSNWNIMDGGAYLNGGRTPPTYSAYDRFFLRWLTPTLLNSASELVLNELQSSNQAYIITQDGTHNLDGANPQPLEFFTLENRQKIGWDAYLPNSGMLITRIKYNKSDWYNNSPNNNSSAMGVDIIEADGIANESTLRGDPFPGSTNVTSYSPTLRSGLNIGSPLTEIRETNGIIYFKYKGGKNPININTNHKAIVSFSTIYGTPSAAQELTVSGYNIPTNLVVSFHSQTHFELKRKDDPSHQWVKSITLAAVDSLLDSTILLVRYNPTAPSFKALHTDYLNFIINNVVVTQGIVSGTSTRPVIVVPPVANNPTTSISLNGFTANWNAVDDATGYYLSVYELSAGSTTLKEGFNNGSIPPIGWTINASSILSNENYVGDSIPAIQLQNTGDAIQTEVFDFPATEFSFYIRSFGETRGIINVEASAGEGWDSIGQLDVNNTLNTIKKYPLTQNKPYTQFRIVYTKGISSVAIDDVAVKLGHQVSYIHRNTWTTDTTFPIDMILPGKKYYYTVKASDKTYFSDSSTIKYENITATSNIVAITIDRQDIVQFSTKHNAMAVYKDTDGTVILDKSKVSGYNSHIIHIYSVDGRLIETLESSNTLVSLTTLTKGQFYIVRVGSASIKVIL